MEIENITGNVSFTKDQENLLPELQAQLHLYRDQALGYHEGELGVRARESWEYYYGNLPKAITKGSSKYVDRTVFEAVNGVCQELSNVFTSSEEAVRFSPIHKGDGQMAVAATTLVNKILLEDNQGFKVLNDCFKEACVTRNSFVKSYWKEEEVTEVRHVDNITEEEVELVRNELGEDLIAVEIEYEAAEEGEVPVGSGVVSYRRKREGVQVEYTPFEQVLVEPSAVSLQDANYIGHRAMKTKDELYQLGFDPTVIQGATTASSDIEAGVIANSRINNLSPLNVSDNIMVGDEKADKIWLYENYLKTSLLSGEMETLQIFTINNEILEVNRVDSHPFETIVPLPIPGFIWGESVADITKDLQDLNTHTVRGMIDNVMNANHRRYTAIKGAYDRRALLDNRPGGVVEVQTPGAIDVFPYHPLPQGMPNLLEYIEQKKEQRTGVTRLSQGLNPDVFKNDNAFATVDTMLSAAQNRLRMICRNVANAGMSSLMKRVYSLVKDNATKPITVRTAQGPVELDPSTMPERRNLIVNLAIGTNERRERGQTLISLFNGTLNNPATAGFMQPHQVYHAATEIYKSLGIYDTENYLTAPADLPPPPEPSPSEEMAVQTQAEQIKLIQAQTAKIMKDMELDQGKFEFDQMKTADTFSMQREESLSTQDENADKMSIEEAKLAIEQRRVLIQEAELELNKQRVLIEAQLESMQNRGVSVAGQTPSLAR